MEHKGYFLLIGIIKIGKALKHQENRAIVVFFRIKIYKNQMPRSYENGGAATLF
jgi:hypothetical protein